MRATVYIHVPKCGGSSFGAALRLRAFWSQASVDLKASRAAALAADPELAGAALIRADYACRRQVLERLLTAGTRVITAHATYDAALHRGPGAGHLWVTLLRDPVARFVSHFRYLQRWHPDPARPDRLEAFLDTEDARRLATQTLFYFSRDWAGDGPVPAAQIDRARRALAALDLVGRLEESRVFARDLGRLVRSPLPHLRRNRAPGPGLVPAALRPRIEALCAPDLELYETAFPAPAAA